MSSLTVVIPARNEAGRIGPAVRAVHRILAASSIAHDIVVVDDASVDDTYREVAALRGAYPLQVLRHRAPRGKGGAIASGFSAAEGDFAAFIDADLEFPPQVLPLMWRTVQESAAPKRCCAVGVRSRDERTFLERITSKAAHVAIRGVLRLPVADTQAGVKLFPGWFAREVLSGASQNGWMFDVEALLLARSAGLEIATIPLRQRRVRARRATPGEYLRCAVVLARLAASARAAREVATARSE